MAEHAGNGLRIGSLLAAGGVTLQDVACDGACRNRSPAECSTLTHLVFPYRGGFVRHVGSNHSVGDSTRVLIFNAGQDYQVSHPVTGGDRCLSIRVEPELLEELCPADRFDHPGRAVFKEQSRRIDPTARRLAATLVHRLKRASIDPIEAESRTIALVRRAFAEPQRPLPAGTFGRRRLVERAKQALLGDVERRWTLSELARAVGVSPVYLAQLFTQVEGVSAYQYHLQLRLARALDLLASAESLTDVALQLGFSSHSHFSHSFRRQFGRSPSDYRRDLRRR